MSISTVVTSMKDEAPYILEWVAYHRALGFDRVVVVANDCTDGTHEMLRRLHKLDAIAYYENDVPVGAKPHSHALKIATLSPEVKSADFVMVLDADEFLVVKSAPHRVDALIDVMQRISADMMVIPWRMFGSSHQAEFEDRPVIDRFTRSMDATDLPSVGVKTLFRQADNLRLAIHFPKFLMKDGAPVPESAKASWIDAGGRPLRRDDLTWNGGRQVIYRDFAEVAHFMIKSLDEYLLKIFRGDGLMNSNRHGIDYWLNADRNEVADLSLLDNVPGFRAEYDRLFADPVLARLHRHAVRARVRRLDGILANPDVQQLRDILKKSTCGGLQSDDFRTSRALVAKMSPTLRTDKLIQGDVPHSTLLSITDAGLADATEISSRLARQARENGAMFWPEKKFKSRPITRLVEGLKRAQKNGYDASLGIRRFDDYRRMPPGDGWPLDTEILVVLTRDDDRILQGYPDHIAQSKHAEIARDGSPALCEIIAGDETPAQLETLIAAGKLDDPRTRLRQYLAAQPEAIELNLDRPGDVAACLARIAGLGPSGQMAAEVLRQSLDLEPSGLDGAGDDDPVAHTVAPPLPAVPAATRSLDIGVLTVPMNRNYGGNLQAFALMQSLRDLGHRPVLLNRRHSAAAPLDDPAEIAEDDRIPLFSDSIGLGRNVENRSFIDTHLAPITREFHSSSSLGRQIGRYDLDAIVVGSDQVWRPKYARSILSDFFLGFLPAEDRRTRRISYGASFGSEEDEYSPAIRQDAARSLGLFDAVSVREDSAVEMCRSMFGVEAEHVLDPTLLLAPDDYLRLLSPDQRTAPGGHLLTYVLDADADKLDVIGQLSRRLGLVPHTTSGLPFDSSDPLRKKGGDKTVEGWLAAFHGASYVITDSFHGVAFSILFNKPFLAYGNAGRGLARFTSILRAVGLEDRLVVEAGPVDLDRLTAPIDWADVNARLAAFRTRSIAFLKASLDGGPGMDRTAPAKADRARGRTKAAAGGAPADTGLAVIARATGEGGGTEVHPLNVLCSGCGACVSESGGRLSMVWTRDGFLEPGGDAADLAEAALKVCPFNPDPAPEVRDEDALAALFLAEADRTDPRLGRFVGSYVGYSHQFRPSSSSGGVATYVMQTLLARGVVDTLFVVQKDKDGTYRYGMHGPQDDIRQISGTRYVPVTMERLFTIIEQTEGRVAVSAVASFVKALRLKQHYHPALKDKIPFVVGILCGGLKSRLYTDFLAASAGISGPFSDAEYRLKNPEGLSSDYSFSALDGDKRPHRVRMQKLGDMWGTGLFKAKACDFCSDVMTELADISLGDAWLPDYKQDGMGNSVIVTRTPLAEDIIREGIRARELSAQPVSPDIAARTQSGGFHHKQRAMKFRLWLAGLSGGRALPFIRPRILADSSAGDMFVQILRERARAKSIPAWQAAGDAPHFLRRMKPALRLLSAATSARKQNPKVHAAALAVLADPRQAALPPDQDLRPILPVLNWLRQKVRHRQVGPDMPAPILPDRSPG